MPLSTAQKKLVLQTVHCTKYLKATHGNFHLEHNQRDNNWYYKRWDKPDLYCGKATINPNNWKHNLKFELKDKQFTGVVVKIEKILLSTTLGVYKKETENMEAFDYAPSKQDGCDLMAATVFFRNGCKRIVPLDCIVEYEDFCDGKNTKLICKNLHTLVNDSPFIPSSNEENKSDNKISLKDDGSIEIENSYLCINSETGELITMKRYLVLNVKNRVARFYAEKEDEWFFISDDEYSRIMEIMNKQMKEECGFIPDLSYGQTNFDRLVNFANYPFVPELNAFSRLFKDITPGSTHLDWYNVEFFVPSDLERQLKYNPSAVADFIKLFNLPYSSKNNKIFLQGHREFLEYAGIWNIGIRDEKSIEKIISADTNKLISKAVSDKGIFGTYTDENDDEYYQQTYLTFTELPDLFTDIRFLFRMYDINTIARLTVDLLKEKESYSTPDALQYFMNLYDENLLNPAIIKKVGKEGFTEYNHDLLMRTYRDAHPAPEEHFENQAIEYDENERELCWQNSDYEFCLPEDTNRLVEIGSKMNICVGHLYREKAAQKRCTIVYAVKDNSYELCIEVQKTDSNQFKLIQKSAFSNHAPQGKMLEVFNQWCRVKGVW